MKNISKCHTTSKNATMYNEDCPHVKIKKFSKQEILDLLPKRIPEPAYEVGWNSYRQAVIDALERLA